jgi:hypothetical protein
MNSISKFAVATLAALTVASLASATASAHGGGGGGGGHGFGGGFAGPASSVGHASPAGGYAHAPFAAGSFGRSSVVPRLVGSAGNGRRIPTQTLISQFPKAPVTVQDPNHNHPRPGWGWGGYATVDVSAENCLIQRYLPNGRVLFRDICTRETWLSR